MNVDTTEITHISICSGYGGIDLGLRRVLPNLRTVAYAEIEAFAIECLLARMENGQLDAAPIWSDLKSFPWSQFFGLVDIISGGFPCQPFSSAGKRARDEDARHLFPHILEGIRQCRPSIVFLENVEGIISSKLAGDHWNDPAGTPVLLHVLRELERVGYKTAWGVFSAAECGAPHQRKRVFILAYLCDKGSQGLRERGATQGWETSTGHLGSGCDVWPSRPGQPQHAWEPPRVVGNASSSKRRANNIGGGGQEDKAASDVAAPSGIVGNAEGRMSGQSSTGDWRESAGRASEGAKSMGNAESGARLGWASGDERHAAQPDQDAGHGQAQPALGRDADGSTGGLDYAELSVSCDNRTDELRLLGNGVVPATAALAFRTLLNEVQPSVHH